METNDQEQATPIIEGDYSATDVAKFFIIRASKNKIDDGLSEGITNLKLQKILYFAQAAHVALYNKKIFKDKIVAWKYGPIVEPVYFAYKKFKNNPIPASKESRLRMNKKDIEFLNGVWDLFEKYSASELVSITHQHAPWRDAYGKGKNSEIKVEQLRDYYKNIFQVKDGQE